MIRNLYIFNIPIKFHIMKIKSRKLSNKRGVSPLIATILLISFAVALGAVVMNWGRNLDISKPGDICSGISIKIRDIDNSQVCYINDGDNAYINFIIDNNGNKNIDGLGVWVTGEKGTKLIDLNEFHIKVGDLLRTEDKSVVYDLRTYGPIKNVQFFPKVKIGDSLEICARNSVKADKLDFC